jgi:hypothetical protein
MQTNYVHNIAYMSAITIVGVVQSIEITSNESDVVEICENVFGKPFNSVISNVLF